MKYKSFFIKFKEFSLKQIKTTFFEDESPEFEMFFFFVALDFN